MKVLIQRNNRQKLASKIAAASFIKQGIPSNDILFLEFENNILLKSKVGKKYLRKGKIKIFKDDLQSFTLLRFLGPEFIKYKEKILIIDPDVFALQNPNNITSFLDNYNSLACTFINGEPRTEVMLVNAEKVKWKFSEIIEKLFDLELDYNDLMNLRFDKNLKISKLDINYNSHDIIKEDTIFLHTSNRLTQPWKEGLKVDFERFVSQKNLFKHTIRKYLGLKYNKNLLTDRYQRHPSKEVIIKFKEIYEYAIKNNIINNKEIQMSVERKFFSTNFLN
jgi:hypothetical protein